MSDTIAEERARLWAIVGERHGEMSAAESLHERFRDATTYHAWQYAVRQWDAAWSDWSRAGEAYRARREAEQAITVTTPPLDTRRDGVI